MKNRDMMMMTVAAMIISFFAGCGLSNPSEYAVKSEPTASLSMNDRSKTKQERIQEAKEEFEEQLEVLKDVTPAILGWIDETLEEYMGEEMDLDEEEIDPEEEAYEEALYAALNDIPMFDDEYYEYDTDADNDLTSGRYVICSGCAGSGGQFVCNFDEIMGAHDEWVPCGICGGTGMMYE